jgi:hypothetical protein
MPPRLVRLPFVRCTLLRLEPSRPLDRLSVEVLLGAAQDYRKGNALRIRKDVRLRPHFAAIRRVRAGLLPPKTARTELLSTTARSQSIRSASRSFASKSWCSLSRTPAACQSRSRRQQVIPDPQPSSRGSIAHGIITVITRRIRGTPIVEGRSTSVISAPSLAECSSRRSPVSEGE